MRINLYLFRRDVEMGASALRKPDEWLTVPLEESGEEDVAWSAFVRRGEQKPPRWLQTLETIMASAPERRPGPILLTQSAGAVLLITALGRLFAITFGTGHHAIDPSRIENDFGLRVTANSVDPARLNAAESRGFDKGMKSSVSKLPIPNEIFALGLATNEDWIKRLGGKVADGQFAVSASGADSLSLNIKDFSILRLYPTLQKALSLFESKAYEAHFPFLDYFRRIPDKDPIVQHLDGQVYEQMDQRSNLIGFAAPDEFQVVSPDHFIVKRGRRKVEIDELDTSTVYQALDRVEGWRSPFTSVSVTALGGQGDSQEENAKFRRYVVATTSVHREGVEFPEQYALTAGSWFRIDAEYADRVARYVDSIEDVTDEVGLPTWDSVKLKNEVPGSYDEERYNRFVSEHSGFRLLDRDFYYGSAGQRVEVCDLLTPSMDLLCVKRLDGAEKMSHLFQQGSVSADLMKDAPYRGKVVDALRELREVVPDTNHDGNWRFVFSIATHRPGPIRELLSFFSKVALMTQLQRIQREGFRVAVAKIERTTPELREVKSHAGENSSGDAEA